MTKEQSNGVRENLGRETVHHVAERFSGPAGPVIIVSPENKSSLPPPIPFREFSPCSTQFGKEKQYFHERAKFFPPIDAWVM